MIQEVICKNSNGNQVSNGYCPSSSKPTEPTQSCNTHTCPAVVTYYWYEGEWTNCSASCG